MEHNFKLGLFVLALLNELDYAFKKVKLNNSCII